MHKVYLKPGKEDSLKRFHPWIFSGAIAHFDGEPEEGEVVEVYTSKKEFIAEGHFQFAFPKIVIDRFLAERQYAHSNTSDLEMSCRRVGCFMRTGGRGR